MTGSAGGSTQGGCRGDYETGDMMKKSVLMALGLVTVLASGCGEQERAPASPDQTAEPAAKVEYQNTTVGACDDIAAMSTCREDGGEGISWDDVAGMCRQEGQHLVSRCPTSAGLFGACRFEKGKRWHERFYYSSGASRLDPELTRRSCFADGGKWSDAQTVQQRRNGSTLR